MPEIPALGSVTFSDMVQRKVPYEWGYGSTPRIAKLREGLYYKASTMKEWGSAFMAIFDSSALKDKIGFRSGLKLDMDRAWLLTQSYKETEGQPEILRRAKAMVKICEEFPVSIKPNELIVGDPNSAPNEVRWYPELCVSYMPDAVKTGGFAVLVPEEEKEEIEKQVDEICDYWNDRCLEARVKAVKPSWMAGGMGKIFGLPGIDEAGGIYSESATIPGYDYDVLFRDGLKARIKRAEAKLEELQNYKVAYMNPTEYVEKKNAWEAMAMCGRGAIRFAERYAEEARKQASTVGDETRRKELEEMAAVLDRVPGDPVQTFHEAVQFYWIIEVVGRYLAVNGFGCGIRVDQIWWPYYEADMKADRITREKALELVESLFLKVQEVGIGAVFPPFFAALSGGEIYYGANIGGSKD